MVDVTILSTVSSLDFEQLVKNNNRQNVKNLVVEKCGENCLKLGSKLKKQLVRSSIDLRLQEARRGKLKEKNSFFSFQTCITLSKRNDK
ncbi:hypothetical protein TPS_04988 [Trichinella pseudospiralis]